MKLLQVILSNMPNKRSPLSWLPFILVLLIMIPLLIVMIILLPVLLLFNWVKMRFFPNKTPKTFVTPFGFAAYSQVERSLLNYPWHDIEKVEVWAEQGSEHPVLLMKSGVVVPLKDMPVDQVQRLCQQHQVPFYEEVVLVQEG